MSSSSRLRVLTLELVYDDGTRQRSYDERFGTGLIKVRSAMHSYRG